jgi:uncharacterized protein involved in oxidation of intracellular sulfur
MLIQSAPYGEERVWNAFRLAQSLVVSSIGMKVNIFLTGDAVTTAKRGQKPPKGYYHLEKMLEDLIKKGVEVICCQTCIAARGLTQEELIDGVKVGSTVGDLARWIKQSNKIISF